MVKEAEEHEREDKDRREQVERRNKLDNLCYTLEKTLSENKDKIQPADLATLEGLIKEGREAVEKQDDDKVKDVSERLEKEAHRLAGQMYGASAPPGSGTNGGPPQDGGGADGVPPGGGDKKKDGGVIDAEFEETGG
jgi:molecular chaperone DnaK